MVLCCGAVNVAAIITNETFDANLSGWTLTGTPCYGASVTSVFTNPAVNDGNVQAIGGSSAVTSHGGGIIGFRAQYFFAPDSITQTL